MSDLKLRMNSLADETTHEIAFRTHAIWRKWGAEDYPADGGVAFRNQLFLFDYWMQLIFRNSCTDNVSEREPWICANAPTLLRLTSEEFMLCIGIACTYMEAFWLHLSFTRQLVGLDFTEERNLVRHCFAIFGKQLDWICNIHAVPTEIAKGFHDLLLQHRGAESYMAASKQQLGRALLQTALRATEASSSDGWDRWATSASMSSRSQLQEEPHKSEQFCNRVFSQF